MSLNLALILVHWGKSEDSIQHFDYSLACFDSIASQILVSGLDSKEVYDIMIDRCNIVTLEKAKALCLSGANAVDRHEVRKGLALLQEAKKLLSKFDDDEKLVQTSITIANAYHLLNEFGEALENYKTAHSILDRIYKNKGTLSLENRQKYNYYYFMSKISAGFADTLKQISANKEALMYYSQSREYLKKYREDSETKFWLRIQIDVGVANVMSTTKKYDQALKQYTLILNRLKRIANSELEAAAVEMNVGNTYLLMERFDEAQASYHKAKEVYLSKGDYERVAKLYNNIGMAFFNQKKNREAEDAFERSRDISASYGFIKEESTALLGLARVHFDLGNISDSYQCALQSFQIMEYIRGGIKSLHLQRDLLQDYLRLLDCLGEIHLYLYNKGNNIGHLTSALNFFELMKNTTLAESIQIEPFISNSEKTKELMMKEDKLVNLLQFNMAKLETLVKLRGTGKIAELAFKNSKETWEKEYTETYNEVENLRLECLISGDDIGCRPIPRRYNILFRALEAFPKNEKWIILEYVFSTACNRWIVFLISQEGSVDYEILATDSQDIQKIALRCRKIPIYMRGDWDKKADRALRAISKELYHLLVPKKIGDIMKKLNIDYVIIVPDNILHWIPFEIIYDGDEYWGLKYALSYNFSLDIGRICLSRFNKYGLFSSIFLLVQNPTCDLEGADEEGEMLMDLVKSKKAMINPLVREQAKEKDFLFAANSDDYSVYHHAGHAQFFGKNPTLSYLRFHANNTCYAKACGGTENLHTPEMLNANEIIQKLRFRRAPLLYLSACETGISETETGEVFGLLRSLIYAGATSLVSSKWSVKDEIGPIFAEVFYNRLLEGDSASVALKEARKATFNRDPMAVSNWAVFSLNGNPFQSVMR